MKERIRLHEFDLMKGFAMLSVVLGHIYMPCFFQLYHIPLFFFVSGFFFKEKPVKDYIKGNCKQLIKPYIVVGVIISLVYLLFYGFPYFKLYAIDLLLGTSIKNDLRIYLGPIWFLLTLFWVRIIYNKLTRHLSPYIIITIILILTGITVLIGHHFNWLQVPYMIIQAIPAMFFFSLGHIYRTSGLYNYNKIKNSNKLLIISITTIIALTYFQIQGPIFNISTMTIPFFPMSFINAILWIYVIYRISIYIYIY